MKNRRGKGRKKGKAGGDAAEISAAGA